MAETLTAPAESSPPHRKPAPVMPKPGNLRVRPMAYDRGYPGAESGPGTRQKNLQPRRKPRRRLPPRRNRVINRSGDRKTPIPDSTNCLTISGKRAFRLKN